MKNIQILIAGLLLIFTVQNVAVGQTLKLTIENQMVVGNTFKFDIVMQATVGEVCLGTADLVLTFNSTNFTSPATTINDGSSDGSTFFSLKNSLGTTTTSFFAQLSAVYESYVSPSAIATNEIILNVNTGFGGASQTAFDKDVAKLANGNRYQFGRYVISGLTNPTGNMGLAWNASSTKIYAFANTTPWNMTKVTLDLPAVADQPLPVELTAFTASVNQHSAQISWSTATEVNNYGFDIERRTICNEPSAVSNWQKVGFVNGNGTSNVQHSYSFSDNVTESGTYAYRLKQIDNGGVYKYSQETEVTIEVPKVFTLNQNYPNPFNPTTTITFTLAQDGITVLRIFDMLGREVATLANGEMKAGVVQKFTFDASRLASGLYFSFLESNGQRQIKKIMLLK